MGSIVLWLLANIVNEAYYILVNNIHLEHVLWSIAYTGSYMVVYMSVVQIIGRWLMYTLYFGLSCFIGCVNECV